MKEKSEVQSVTNSLSLVFRKGKYCHFQWQQWNSDDHFLVGYICPFWPPKDPMVLGSLRSLEAPILSTNKGKKDQHKYPAQKHLIKFTTEQFCFLRQHWALGVREMNLWADCVVSVVAYCHFKTWQVPWLLCDTVYEIAFGKNCPCIQLYIHFSPWDVCIFQYIVHFKSDESSTCCTDTNYLW